MRHKVALYVSAVGALAFVAALGVHALTPDGDPWGIGPAICFAGLGFFAQALGHKIGQGAQGNISFLPFLTISLLAPNLTSVITVAIAVTVVEVSAKREKLKGIFNVAQYALAVSLAIVAYRLAGGIAFLAHPDAFRDVSAQPLTVFLPSIALVLIFLMVNGSAVSGAIAVSSGQSFHEVWRTHVRMGFAYDVLSLPFVLMFVGVYSLWGPTGAVLLAAPMLAVRQLYKTNWQLQRVNQDLLQLMVAAIEARDPYTSGHSRRVSRYARIIASCLGLGSRHVERVATAALLHDVGKIHEAFAPILQKPGKLTPEERQIMETHPIKSAELVANLSHLQDIVKPVLHHHENWDGTGYPNGLKGEEIPLESRIIMLADTMDAMLTDRPYRKALTEADVRREIMKYQGSQFDPGICEKMMASPLFTHIFEAVDVPRSRTPLSTAALKRWTLSKLTA